MRLENILLKRIWLKIIPTIVDWETNKGALIKASTYEVIDSSEPLAEGDIDMVVSLPLSC